MNHTDLIHSEWSEWMQRALQLASLAEGKTSPNPLVGAVVLDKEKQLVGEGFHACAGMPHAEVGALAQAGDRAKDGTLVVTLEPCCHQGKTPPCTQAIVDSGISRVVVALKDPDPRVNGSGLEQLKRLGIDVITDVLKEQAAIQNREFLFRVANGRPWGILKWAMSLDGRTALTNGASQWISSTKSRNWVHRLRAKCDAVIVGGGTVRSDNPLLTSRGISDPEPLRVVLSRTLNLPDDSRLWDTEVAETFIAFGREANQESLATLPDGPGRIALNSSTPKDLLEELAKKNCNRVLWECGPSLASAAISQGCVQELVVLVAPKLLGGVPARTPLAELGLTAIDEALPLKAKLLKKLDEDWLINVHLPQY